MPISNFQPIRLLDPDLHSADPDQLASTLFEKAGHFRVQQD